MVGKNVGPFPSTSTSTSTSPLVYVYSQPGNSLVQIFKRIRINKADILSSH